MFHTKFPDYIRKLLLKSIQQIQYIFVKKQLHNTETHKTNLGDMEKITKKFD